MSELPQVELIAISKLKENPKNPRFITEDRLDGLAQSIKDLPDMLHLRPIVVDEDFVIIGGNQRVKAAKLAGQKKVPVVQVSGWSDEKKKEFGIKDNVASGQWDWDVLEDPDEYSMEDLKKWNVEIYQDHDPELSGGGGNTKEPKRDPKPTDSDYARFEMIMLATNKERINERIKQVKEKHGITLAEEALMHIINGYTEEE